MILILPGQPLTNSAHHKQVYIPVENLYKQCFHEYFEKLFGYAFTIVKDNAEARDIVQSAFVKLWEKRGEINFPGAARAYLYTTVYHLALNTIRDRKIRERHYPDMAPVAHVNSIDTAQEKEIKARIQQAIDALPPRCREVFCKSRLEGKKYSTIAAEMDISVKTVEVHMGKALKLLREQLADLASIWIIFLFL
ncbi:MAG: RNA polymerase sigma-70 factor [Niastella sp.]|nr:RNA polymerase sigma-70 factor [Niastella sp.]